MSQNKTETSNVDDDEYLNNNEEPVEMISEMSPEFSQDCIKVEI
jgi:hypothetical protein